MSDPYADMQIDDLKDDLKAMTKDFNDAAEMNQNRRKLIAELEHNITVVEAERESVHSKNDEFAAENKRLREAITEARQNIEYAGNVYACDVLDIALEIK